MNLGKIVGTVISTMKDEKLTGTKLQVVRQIDLDLRETGSFVPVSFSSFIVEMTVPTIFPRFI